LKDYTKRFEGSFQCNEIKSWNYTGIAASFHSFWFGVPCLENAKSQLRNTGPQLKIDCLNTSFITNSLNFCNGGSIKLDFSGSYLGHIDCYSGYTAADIGAGMFLITKLAFEMIPKKNVLHVNLSGICERNYCSSVHIPEWNGNHPNFKICFVVGVSELAQLFPELHEEHIRNMSQRLFGSHL